MNNLSRVGKTLLIIIVVVGTLNILHRWSNKEQEWVVAGQTPEIVADIDQNPVEATFEDLLDAIEWVESKGKPNAIGDGGAAIGAYQIHKIYVDDVNRILMVWKGKLNEAFDNYHKQHPDPNNIKSVDSELYTYEDRWNKIHSRFMTEVYLTYYTPLDDKLNINLEYAARIHNGGPNGWKKECTKPYWEKIKKAIERE